MYSQLAPAAGDRGDRVSLFPSRGRRATSERVLPPSPDRLETSFRDALVATIDGMLVVDRAGTVCFANPAAENLLGWSAGALLGHRFGLPLAPRGNIAELDVLRPDGVQIVVEMHIGAMRWETEEADLVTLRDVTRRKTAEAELRSSEERYALAARGANDALWDLDLSTDRLYTSARWQDMLGLAPGHVTEQLTDWTERVHPEDVSSFRDAIKRHLRKETDRLMHEHRLRRADGEYVSVLARGVAVHEDGRPVRLAGSRTDLTAAQELRYRALHDALTGLGNRTLFIEHLKTALGRERRLQGNYRIAVLFLDLDRFKPVNDSLGHAAGDILLTTVARRIDGCLRTNDLCARLGGDEFAILLDDAQDPQAVLAATTRIQEAIAMPVEVGGDQVYTTASIGIVLTDEEHLDAEETLRHADIAMYRAKSRGPGNFEIFERGMHKRAVERLRFHSELRGAVERSEFIVRYQPVVDLVDGGATGFEALLRWRHPDHGILDAGSFIDAAEETGVIMPLGWNVLDAACRQARVWTELDPSQRVSVNVSHRQFQERDFADRVKQALDDSGLAGPSLQLEITERVIVDDYEFATDQLERCHALGVEIMIDDFGTGHSSLTALHRLPIDIIKVDRSFVTRLGSDGEGAEVVEAILSLARSLGLDVIAEGIETPEQRERLVDLGCRIGQGYLFERALDADEATTYLDRPASQPPREPVGA
ncbi:hypothetical protein BH18ACT15_BH18ACT15_04510 [soil metagenome]